MQWLVAEHLRLPVAQLLQGGISQAEKSVKRQSIRMRETDVRGQSCKIPLPSDSTLA